MRDYARHQTALLIARFTVELNRAARDLDADSIHDMRVAMRRLSRCLRVFAPFYPPRSWKKIRHRISVLMAAAGAVRDCDIAIELAGRAGVSPRSGLVAQLVLRRRKSERDLVLEIRRWKRHDSLDAWPSRLEL